MEPVISKYIESRPDRCSGRPCIAGTRIRVQDIACDHEVHGLTPEQIAREYPQIGLAQVHAALAYYFDHRVDIQRHISEDEQLVATLELQAAAGLRVVPGVK
jgi:uncharacterized protein (DUF433 family)